MLQHKCPLCWNDWKDDYPPLPFFFFSSSSLNYFPLDSSNSSLLCDSYFIDSSSAKITSNGSFSSSLSCPFSNSTSLNSSSLSISDSLTLCFFVSLVPPYKKSHQMAPLVFGYHASLQMILFHHTPSLMVLLVLLAFQYISPQMTYLHYAHHPLSLDQVRHP